MKQLETRDEFIMNRHHRQRRVASPGKKHILREINYAFNSISQKGVLHTHAHREPKKQTKIL